MFSIKKVAMRLGIAAAAATLAVGVAAVPAQASVYGCPDSGYLCVWNYESFNYVNDGHGGIWTYNLHNGYNSCHVMPTSGIAGWTNGKVYNAASSMIINNSGTNNLATAVIHLYDSNACSGTDYSFIVGVTSGDIYFDARLANSGWNDRIGSFKASNN